MIASGLWCEMHRSSSKDDVLIERDDSYEEFLSLLGMATYDELPAKESLEFVIFNDGVPSSVMPEHDVIRHISDEAIDDLFPPSVDDVRFIIICITHLQIVSNAWSSIWFLPFLLPPNPVSINYFITDSRNGGRRRLRGTDGLASISR
jgi:hypothetical protein